MVRKDNFIQITRVVSALGVFLVHFGQLLGLGGWLRNITDLGQYCLYFFFVISGYLICNWNGENRKDWIKKKIIRLAPLYYAMLVFYMGVHHIVLKNVPPDPLHLGWLRFFTGINSLLPSEEPFWKSIHALWYVSVVWIFYCIVCICWKKLKNLSIFSWYAIFVVTLALALVIYKIDDNASTSILCFFEYFVLGIIANKYTYGKHIIIVPLISLVVLIVFMDWLTVNIMVATVFSIIIIIFKNRFNCYPNKFIEKVINACDECTYALFLVHPVFIDLVVPFLKMYSFNNVLIIIFSLILMIVVVLCAHYIYEKNIQKILFNICNRKKE